MVDEPKVTAGYGARVRMAREFRELSAARLDVLANLTIGHTARIEREDAGVALETATKHAAALRVRLEYLATGDAPMTLEEEAAATVAA